MPTGITIGSSGSTGDTNMANDFLVQGSAPGSAQVNNTVGAGVMNPRGQQITAAGALAKSEIVRLGRTYECSIATGSAFTHVAAWPTTRAELVIKNVATDGTCLVIDSAWSANVATSVAAANTYTLLGQIVSSSATATIGEGIYVDLNGGWIVPPGALFLLNLVVGTATGTSCIGVVWHEMVVGINA